MVIQVYLKLDNKDDLAPIDDCFNKYELNQLNEGYKKVLERKGFEYLNKLSGLEGEIQRFKAYKTDSFFTNKSDFLKSLKIKSSEKNCGNHGKCLA